MQKGDDRLGLSLSEINLIVRTINCLEDENIFTVQDLLNCTPERLLEIPNFGETTLKTIYAALAKIGFPQGQNTVRREKTAISSG
jgi:DNA-directed RNA polymerase subunit alpha